MKAHAEVYTSYVVLQLDHNPIKAIDQAVADVAVLALHACIIDYSKILDQGTEQA